MSLPEIQPKDAENSEEGSGSTTLEGSDREDK